MVDIGELMENLISSFNVQFLQLVRDHHLHLMETIYAEMVMKDLIVLCVKMDISRNTMGCVRNAQLLLLLILMCCLEFFHFLDLDVSILPSNTHVLFLDIQRRRMGSLFSQLLRIFRADPWDLWRVQLRELDQLEDLQIPPMAQMKDQENSQKKRRRMLPQRRWSRTRWSWWRSRLFLCSFKWSSSSKKFISFNILHPILSSSLSSPSLSWISSQLPRWNVQFHKDSWANSSSPLAFQLGSPSSSLLVGASHSWSLEEKQDNSRSLRTPWSTSSSSWLMFSSLLCVPPSSHLLFVRSLMMDLLIWELIILWIVTLLNILPSLVWLLWWSWFIQLGSLPCIWWCCGGTERSWIHRNSSQKWVYWMLCFKERGRWIISSSYLMPFFPNIGGQRWWNVWGSCFWQDSWCSFMKDQVFRSWLVWWFPSSLLSFMLTSTLIWCHPTTHLPHLFTFSSLSLFSALSWSRWINLPMKMMRIKWESPHHLSPQLWPSLVQVWLVWELSWSSEVCL